MRPVEELPRSLGSFSIDAVTSTIWILHYIVSIVEEEGLTKVIRNVESWGTTLSDRVEIRLTFGKFAGVY
jgi:hypothetical protein